MKGSFFDELNEAVKKGKEAGRKWASDVMSEEDVPKRCSDVNHPNQAKNTETSYAEVVRELLGQIDNGCDIIPIGTSFSYEDLMAWISANARGNKAIIIKGTLTHTTGQILAVAFARDNMVLLSKDMPKACFVYQNLNPTIVDLFPGGTKVCVKPLKIV